MVAPPSSDERDAFDDDGDGELVLLKEALVVEALVSEDVALVALSWAESSAPSMPKRLWRLACVCVLVRFWGGSGQTAVR